MPKYILITEDLAERLVLNEDEAASCIELTIDRALKDLIQDDELAKCLINATEED